MDNTDSMLADIAGRHAATTGTNWHWAGNTDTGEPYLAALVPGAGRCHVLSIGKRPRSTTGRSADQIRSDAHEFDLGDPEDAVARWAYDRHGEPATDPVLQLTTDLMCVDARDLVTYEVAPEAASRDDPAVYRADIQDIRHPDAEFIAHSRDDVGYLLELVRELRSESDRLKQAATSCRACRPTRFQRSTSR